MNKEGVMLSKFVRRVLDKLNWSFKFANLSQNTSNPQVNIYNEMVFLKVSCAFSAILFRRSLL